MESKLINGETWQQSGPGLVQVTQHGVRTPNGNEVWGVLDNLKQHVYIPDGSTHRVVITAPGFVGPDESASLRRYRIEQRSKGLRLGLTVEQADELVAKIVPITRTIIISIGETMTSTTNNEES